MDKEEIIVELTNIADDYLKNQGYTLVDLTYRYEGPDLILRILTDRPEGGINLDECSSINTGISRILDERALFPAGYILEVSSPGLDRPLKTKNDFMRCLNWRVRFFFNEPAEGKLELDGIIRKVEDDAVLISTQNKDITVPLSRITRAKQIVE